MSDGKDCDFFERVLQYVITLRESLFQENKRENKTKDQNDYSSFNDPNEFQASIYTSLALFQLAAHG